MDSKALTKELDQWVEQLNECKQLNENQVRTLCEKLTNYPKSRENINPFHCCQTNHKEQPYDTTKRVEE